MSYTAPFQSTGLQGSVLPGVQINGTGGATAMYESTGMSMPHPIKGGKHRRRRNHKKSHKKKSIKSRNSKKNRKTRNNYGKPA